MKNRIIEGMLLLGMSIALGITLFSCSSARVGCESTDWKKLRDFDSRKFRVNVTRIDTTRAGMMVHMKYRYLNEYRVVETFCDCNRLPDSVFPGATITLTAQQLGL
jgi:hypothetical protein